MFFFVFLFFNLACVFKFLCNHLWLCLWVFNRKLTIVWIALKLRLGNLQCLYLQNLCAYIQARTQTWEWGSAFQPRAGLLEQWQTRRKIIQTKLLFIFHLNFPRVLARPHLLVTDIKIKTFRNLSGSITQITRVDVWNFNCTSLINSRPLLGKRQTTTWAGSLTWVRCYF